MSITKLASEIAKREGKKSQARIGDIREILSILADIFHDFSIPEKVDLVAELTKSGERRAKRKKKNVAKS
jgi:uncharacterized protein (UPF0147 family)